MGLKHSIYKSVGYIFLLVCIFLHTAMAAEVSEEEKPEVKLLSTYEQYDNLSSLWLGLQFLMPEGWETYWKYNGDLGKPLSISWEGSENVKNIELYWPEPARMNILGYYLVGYKGNMIFPLKLFVQDPSKPITINLKTNYLVCKEELCLEQNDEFHVTIPAGRAIISLEKILIDKYIRLSPKYVDLAKLEGIYTYTSKDHNQLYYNISFNKEWDNIKDVFVAPLNGTIIGDIEMVSADPSLLHYRFPILSHSKDYFQFEVSVKEQDEYIEFTDLKFPISGEITFSYLLFIFFISFVGGFILNFMPCVLPVITLKAFGAISSPDSSKTKERLNHIASSLGIMTTFLTFAIIAILLKHFGILVGWGMHFREPIFLLIISFVLIIFACNLWGFYEIIMPSFTSEKKAKEEGFLSHFSTGIIATLLATPCTAPFIGTGITFALTQSAVLTLSVFFLIGLGFALPYLYLAISPQTLRKILPKPGVWMLYFKYSVGFILILTTLWLFWIMMFMIPFYLNLILWASSGMIILALFTAKHSKKGFKNLIWFCILILLVTNIYVIHKAPPPSETITSISETVGIPFDPDKIQPALNDNKKVFLIFTAKWCVTCKYNEKFILNSKPVHDALSQKNVLVMVADWTNPNDTIAKFLQRYEQYAIPTYIVFSKEYPQGKVLNSLLTQDEVLKSLNESDN